MFALQFTEYGGPEVISLGEAPEPHAGPGQIRIAVKAASAFRPASCSFAVAALSPSRFHQRSR